MNESISSHSPSDVQAEAAEEMSKQGITFFPGAVTSEGRRIRRWDVLWAVYNQAFSYFELVQQRGAKMEQLQKAFEMVRPRLLCSLLPATCCWHAIVSQAEAVNNS